MILPESTTRPRDGQGGDRGGTVKNEKRCGFVHTDAQSHQRPEGVPARLPHADKHIFKNHLNFVPVSEYRALPGAPRSAMLLA